MKKTIFVICFILIVHCTFIIEDCMCPWVQTGNSQTAICLTPNGTSILAGTWNMGMYVTTNYGTNWTQCGLLGYSVYSIAISGTKIFAGTSNGVYLSYNNGATWYPAGLGAKSVYKLLISGITLLAGTAGFGIYATINSGENWSTTSLSSQTIHALIPNGSNILTGTYLEGIYSSMNGGLNWIQTGMTNKSVRDIFIGGSSLFAACENSPAGSGGVYISYNGGTNWNLTALNNADVYAVYADGNNILAGLLYGGVYLSTNNGTNWSQKNQGFSSLPTVYSFLKSGSYMFVATTQGIWRRVYTETIGIKNISGEIPSTYALFQNYPNPFNQSTMFNFQCSMAGIVQVKVFDITGREVATLVNEKLQPGTYEVTFNSGDLSSGVYFYKLTAGDFTDTKRMILIK